jgi:hypothetical protein
MLHFVRVQDHRALMYTGHGSKVGLKAAPLKVDSMIYNTHLSDWDPMRRLWYRSEETLHKVGSS